ncbi:hypothetical protein [Bauldia litoralis]|uniref:Uncharacterized protein n=1 Tax=Bauldia litoralis TaxID=665467 RepID=A0A1G6E578_9HYPH|nr:hypothetical protein [Bauldia litoralis]SDB52566.1 hypothetical protein SAMN02982931_04134 [Bauldia litoralis]
MSDFYSVLTQSIIDRGLRSARDREATYSQARTAMIRRLWSYDPPLAEDEIDARIGQFDLAVDQIESNVVEVFEGMPETVDEAEPEPAPSPPIIDGYDQEADYAPAFGGSGAHPPSDDDDAGKADPGEVAPPTANEEPARPAARPAPGRTSLTELLSTLDIRSLAVEAALNSDPDEPPETGDDGPEVAPRAELRTKPDDDEPETDGYDDETVDDDRPDDDAAYADAPNEDDAEEAIEAAPSRSYLPVPVSQAREMAGYHHYEEEAVLVAPPPRAEVRPESRERAPAPRRQPASDTRRAPPKKPARRPATGKTAPPKQAGSRGSSVEPRVGILVAAVGVLAVALIALTAYILMPATEGPDVAGQPPAVVTPAPATPAAPAQTAGLPPPAEGTIHRFMLFDGSDPTIFETDPSNPVRFDGSSARIASSAGSAGAKAIIGPGLAARLGGHTVRVIVMARSARENGTANLRFAFQSGLAVSYWKTANLTREFAPIDLTWRVPTMRTDPTGNAIIIEPGIPGDATGAEIGAIVIDVLD